MLDPVLFRQQLPFLQERLALRGFALDMEFLQTNDAQRKRWQTEVENLRNRRNALSKQIGQAKAKGENTDQLMQEVASLPEKLAEAEVALETVQKALNDYLVLLPNVPHASVPVGANETENVEIRRVGTPHTFEFTPLDHVDIGAGLQGMDFNAGAKIAGARFVVMQGGVARLHRAIAQWMLDTHTQQHGYVELNVPYLVNTESAFGTGQLPKAREDMFHLAEQDLWLIPTAELPVTNLARDEIFADNALPKRYVAYSACFRSEAGSYGKDTRGMIRQHQFEKIEMVMMVRPQDSYAALETLTGHAEALLQQLELPYRVMALCTGDLGFASAKTYDLEVWLPSQGRYREISSCSNFESFQARRMQARYRDAGGKIELIHTLNGSGLAVGRTLVAILENYQQGDGSVVIPDVLRPYMGGLDLLRPNRLQSS